MCENSQGSQCSNANLYIRYTDEDLVRIHALAGKLARYLEVAGGRACARAHGRARSNTKSSNTTGRARKRARASGKRKRFL